jgi:hypothetical protein
MALSISHYSRSLLGYVNFHRWPLGGYYYIASIILGQKYTVDV